MESKIKRLDRKLVYEGSILDIYSDEMLLPDGSHANWDFVAHRKGAAAVVPVLEDGRILLVKQFRPALDRMTIEIPAGARDSVTEDTRICAQRELEEETGYCCKKMERILSLKSTVAFCNEFIDVYLATGLYPGKQHLDQGEDIEIEAYTLGDLLERIYKGELQDAKTVSGILAYQNLVLSKKI